MRRIETMFLCQRTQWLWQSPNTDSSAEPSPSELHHVRHATWDAMIQYQCTANSFAIACTVCVSGKYCTQVCICICFCYVIYVKCAVCMLVKCLFFWLFLVCFFNLLFMLSILWIYYFNAPCQERQMYETGSLTVSFVLNVSYCHPFVIVG